MQDELGVTQESWSTAAQEMRALRARLAEAERDREVVSGEAVAVRARVRFLEQQLRDSERVAKEARRAQAKAEQDR